MKDVIHRMGEDDFQDAKDATDEGFHEGPTRDEKLAFWGMFTGAALVVLFGLLLAAAVAFGIYELVGWLID